MHRLPLLLALSACAGTGDKPAGPIDTDTAVGCELLTWHADADGDGYGDPLATIEVCEPPGRQVLDGTDCDDTNAAAFPGAPEDCSTAFDANCDGSTGYADADADGTAACEDCDDANPAVHPAAVEVCDGVDGDCDGAVDDDAVDGRLYYPDADGDTFGDLAGAARLCEAPEGWGSTFTDCDDTDAAVNPDATELCNTIDDDCDGTVDEGDAADAGIYYDDVDGDGFGDEWSGTGACTAPGDAVLVGGDCDDYEPAVNPAAAEVCNALDDDCDGTVDDDARDRTSWYLDADGDGWGDAAVGTAECEAPAGYVAVDGDCDDADGTAAPDLSETCGGADEDCDGTVDEDDAVDAPTWYADLDFDGYGDAATSVRGCEAPDTTGWSLLATDCDDGDASASPGATETCDGRDDDCDGTVDEDDAVDAATWYVDADADGHGDATRAAPACDAPAGSVARADDCDDTDATVSPDAVEVCDGVDDDCDGTADEDDAADAPTWYADADGDAYGADAAATVACTAPSGHVAAGGDCDDTDTAFHPGAAEADCEDPADYNCDGSAGEVDADVDGWLACDDCDDATAAVSPSAAEGCNGVDDDCDGVVDEPGALGAGTWFADTDGDRYGDATVLDHSCTLPAGFVAVGTDCDDTDAAVNPGALEVCATAYDDDCDGDAAELRTPDCTRWYLDFDEDTHGSTSSVCACGATDLFTANAADDCDDGAELVYPGAREVPGDGVDENCDGLVDAVLVSEADAVLAGSTALGQASIGLAGGADVDGDGYDDVLVGASTDDTSGSVTGAAFLVLGPIGDTTLGGGEDAMLTGEGANDLAGVSVALGDADGDGYADALVGAPGNGSGGRSAGAAYLVYGPFTGTLDLASADARFEGVTASDEAGTDVAYGGDLDGDGVGDLVVVSPGADTAVRSGGSVYVVYGPPAAALALDAADAELYGEGRDDAAGSAVASAGDTNGDGVDDLLVGVPDDDDNGAASGTVFLVEGPIAGANPLATVAVAQLVGEAASSVAGSAVAGAGDMDADGYDDVLVGAQRTGTGGRSYLLLSPLTGTMNLSAADTKFESATVLDEVGSAIIGPGDIDGDGLRDVAVGACSHDGGGTSSGAAFLFLAPSTGTYTLDDAAVGWYGDAGSSLGWSLAPGGDTDADGARELLLGALEADVLVGDGGAAYVVSW